MRKITALILAATMAVAATGVMAQGKTSSNGKGSGAASGAASKLGGGAGGGKSGSGHTPRSE
jgi:hypothetical protein